MAALDLTQLMQRISAPALTDDNGQVVDTNYASNMARLQGLYSQYQGLKQLGGLSNIGKYGANTAEYTDPNTGVTQPVQYYAEGTNPGEYSVLAGGGIGSGSTQGDSNTFASDGTNIPSSIMGLGQIGNGQNAFVTALGNTPAFKAPAPDETGGFGSQLTNALVGNEGILKGPIGMAIGGQLLAGFNGAGGDALTYTAQDAGAGAGAGAGAEIAVTPVTDAYGAGAGAGAAGDGALAGSNLNAFDYPSLTAGQAATYAAPAAGYAGAAAATGGSWMDSLLASAGKFGTGLLNNPAPLLGAGLSTLGALYGANQIGNSATNAANTLGAANTNAANLASNASLAATNLQAQQYANQQALQQPFYQAGVNALPAYASGVMPGGNLVKPFSMADYQADPGYGFRFDQGMKALNASMASRGLGVSGPAIKGAINFGQGVASQEYQNAYNRYVNDQATQRNALAGLTGYGPTSASTIGAAGQNYASNVGNLGVTTANTIGGMDLSLAGGINNANMTGAAARQSAYGGAANAFNTALNPNPVNTLLAKLSGTT